MKLKNYFRRIQNKINTKEIFFLLSLFSISLLIRSIGVKHGFPLLTHPDEFVILNPIVDMTSNHTLNPGVYNRPNHILIILNFFYLNIISYLRFGENFAVVFPLHQLNFYHYARLLISFMGSLIPVFAFFIGKEFKPRLGLPIALVFAFFPSYILHSLYITPDIPITLFTLIIIFFTLKFLNTERNLFLYLAILFSAINTAEKYPGLLSLGIPVIGVFIKHLEGQTNLIKIEWWKITKTVIKITVLFLVSLFLVAPNIFLHYPKVIEAIIYETRSSHSGADNLGFIGNLIFYVNAFGSWSNWVALPFILLGSYVLITKKFRYSLVLLYGVFYWVLLSVLSLHWERWALPMYITPLFLISFGIWYSVKIIKKKSIFKFFTILTSVIFFLIQLTHSLHTAVRMSFTDTRVIALEYCRNNEITKNNSLYEGYTPFQPQFPSEIFDTYKKAIDDKEFIILSSSMFGRFYAEPQRYEDKIHFYESIRDEFVLIEQFTPSPEADGVIEQIDDIIYYEKCLLNSCTKDKLKGPTIEIYRINN